jgi:hypothetical protein
VVDKEYHTCHFCGEDVKDGLDPKGERHWISDCRPDLVKHEIGETCTWYNLNPKEDGRNCYAYQEHWSLVWGDEHIHFYEDGPM